MQINLGKIIPTIGYFYICIPACIFLCGWCQWYIWVPGVLICAYCLFQLLRKSKIDCVVDITKKTILIAIAILVIVILWVCLSGIGNISYQNSDHQWRNRIFDVLVNYDWPVTKVKGDNVLVIAYYIGFWLPAALFGKIFGLTAGFIFQTVWAIIGVLLVYGIICIISKKIVLWPLIVFIFFSGLDLIGWLYYFEGTKYLLWSTHVEWWNIFEFSSFTTQLFWAFNQAIYAWVIFLLIMIQGCNRFRLFIASFSILTCPLPFIGMLPFILYWIFEAHCKEYDGVKTLRLKPLLKDTLSVENIVGGGFIGIVSFLYIKINRASGMNVGWATLNSNNILICAIAVVILAVALFFIIKYHQKDVLMYVVSAVFAVIGIVVVVFTREDIAVKFGPVVGVLVLCATIDSILRLKKRENKKIAYIHAVFLIAVLVVMAVVWCIKTKNADTYTHYLMAHYLFGIGLDFVLLYIVTFVYQKRNWLFYISLVWLMICPWITVGTSGDFCMRASIPALVILFLMVIDTLKKSFKSKYKVAFIALIVLLVVGAFSPAAEIIRSVTYPVEMNESITEKRLWKSKNFSGYVGENFFSDFIMRK